MNFLLDHIDLNDQHFQQTLLLSFINTFALALLPYLQYKYKIISKFTGDDMNRAADCLAYILIHIGTFRNYAFIEGTYKSKALDFGIFNYFVITIGVLSLILGGLLVLFAFRKLGLRGMYFGDHFGFIMKKRISSFPYNYTENPHYNGSFMMYLGFSLMCLSLKGICLTFVIILCYQILFTFFEKKRLKEIYKQA
jgi:phosphatidylethanolamine N-methyltransferase